MTTFLDRLTPLFRRFKAQARQFQAGPLCGAIQYGDEHGVAFLHVLRGGTLRVRHRERRLPGLPPELQVDEPSLIFYPRPCWHEFVNPETIGNDFVCATVAFEGREMHPLAQALPHLIVLPLAGFVLGSTTLEMLFDEAALNGNKPSLIADKLFEVLLLQLLRQMLDRPPTGALMALPTGLMAGLAQPNLARALTAIHARPQHGWTVQALAAEAGMSRSAFAEAFRQAVGATPVEYLARWRLACAQQKLLQGRPLKSVAEEVGYGTPAALSRAFSARVGVSPRAWLQQRAAA